jgi:hypothetical protein
MNQANVEMTAQNRKPRPAAKSNYKPTERELAASRKFLKERAECTPRMKVSKGALAVDHPDQIIGSLRLMEALGTTDLDFLDGLLNQLANAGSVGPEITARAINFMLAVIEGIQPRDQVEAMLAAQIAAVHMATMTFARRLNHVENIPQQDSAERTFNKLTRTFATQMEALRRYRTGGEQKVTVQHVNVSEGGQAIVGNVTQGLGAGAPVKAPASPPPLLDARTSVPMPNIDQSKKLAPIPAPRTTKKK